jgi:hypothetical protein
MGSGMTSSESSMNANAKMSKKKMMMMDGKRPRYHSMARPVPLHLLHAHAVRHVASIMTRREIRTIWRGCWCRAHSRFGARYTLSTMRWGRMRKKSSWTGDRSSAGNAGDQPAAALVETSTFQDFETGGEFLEES